MILWIKPMDDLALQKLSEISMSLQVSSGLAVPEFDEEGSISLRIATREEWQARNTTPSPTPKLIPVEPSVRADGKVPFVWVFTCPPPYNGVEIVCVPDDKSEVGIRCTASRPNMSRERDKYDIVFFPNKPGTKIVVMDQDEYQEYQDYIQDLDQER
jgi:hypothetical protein